MSSCTTVACTGMGGHGVLEIVHMEALVNRYKILHGGKDHKANPTWCM